MSRATRTATDRRTAPTRATTAASAGDGRGQRLTDGSEFADRNAELFRRRAELLALLRTTSGLGANRHHDGRADGRHAGRNEVEHLRRVLDDVTTEIVEFNLGLVRSYCRRFTTSAELQDVADFEAAGFLGLMSAIDSFDPDQGRFGSWAFQPIRREVLRAVRDVDHPNVNFGDFERRPEILRAARDLQEAGGGAPPDHREVADAVGVTTEQVRRVLQPPRLESIDEPTGAGRTATQGASTEDPLAGAARTTRAAALYDNRDDPEATAVNRLLHEALDRYGLSCLDPRERHVIVRRYGLDGEPEDTLADLGVALGVARETVRQIEARALEKLRRPEIAERFGELVGG